MKFEASNESFESVKTDLIIINFFKEDIRDNKLTNKTLIELDSLTAGLLQSSVDRKEMKGNIGNTIFMPNSKMSLLLIGCGKEAEYTIEEHKSFGAKGIREAKKRGFINMSFFIRGIDEHILRIPCLIEGIMVGDYSFDLYKNRDDNEEFKVNVDTIKIISCSNKPISSDMLDRGRIIGESMGFARNMVNQPGNKCTPAILANEALRFARGNDIRVNIFDHYELEKMGMGSFLSVSKGSVEPEKLITMYYEPENKKSDDVIALVGKGITFDSGGISIKPPKNMHEMKGDMAGAATVIGAMVAISRLKLNVEVIVVIPVAENMPSGSANKPGDVVTAMNGKSIEILNTDAEGRLILADALCYAVEHGATKIIDLATLTGACVVALGEITTGMMGNNQELMDKFKKACDDVGERVWQLPLFKKYHDQIKSDIADVANVGDRSAGAITAAAFLEKFVDNKPWIHLDIAGTAWSNRDEYYSKGGTGIMVSSLVRFIEGLV